MQKNKSLVLISCHFSTIFFFFFLSCVQVLGCEISEKAVSAVVLL